MDMKFAICNETYKDWKLDDIMAHVSQCGYDAIEIAPFTLAERVTDISADERKEIREAAARHQLEISAIHWVFISPTGLYLNHTDESIRRMTADYLVDLVDFGADIGAKFMIVGSPKARNVLEGVSYEQAWAWAQESFRLGVERAAERDFTICFEPLAPSETNFINTAEEGIRFIKEFDHPNFKIMLDVKAMCSMPKSIPEIIVESAGEFRYFHANDANLKGPGFGEVDFIPIAKALKETGYDGYISVEVFDYSEGPETIATQSLAYLKKTFEV
jgi:sugar phosphate isomerase/epimerase